MSGPPAQFPGEDPTVVIARITASEAASRAAADADTVTLPAVASAGAPGAAGTATAGMRTARTAGVVRAGSTMAVATLVSRVTGFLAKVVLLAFLGFSIVNDAYNLANTLPNIIFELLIGGVLTSVAIPLLSRARADPDGGAAYTQRLMTMMVVGLLAATGAAMAAAPLLTRLYLSSGSTTDPTLATELAYLLLPQIFFYGVAALFGAILNTSERFAAPAWAPVANNVVVIAVGALLLALAGPGAHGGLTSLTRGEFLLLGAGTTAGIVVQAAVLLPALRRSGFRFGWRWGIDSRMVEAGRLLGWAIGYALISQAGYIVTARVASHTHAGYYALYNYGSMLFQLPYGILGVSLLTAIMPRMSRHAAAGEMPAVKHDMGVANRLSTVALLPVTAAMIALAVPLATVTARYGAVTGTQAHILGYTLAAFAVGLLPLAVTLVQMRVFYAMKDARTPTLINLVMVLVRIPLLLACLALPAQWVVPGLAGAMSVSYLVGVVVGEVWLRARFGAMGSGDTLRTVGKVALASAGGGAAAWLVVDRLLPRAGGGVVHAVVQLAVGGLVGLAVVGAVLLLLKVDEVQALRRRLVGPAGMRHWPAAPAKASDGPRARAPGAGAAAGPGAPASAGATAGGAFGPRHGTLVGAAPGPGARAGRTQAEAGPPAAGRQGQVSVTDQHSDAHGGGPGDPPGGRRDDPGATGATAPAHAVAAHAVAAHAVPAAFAPGSVVGERYRLVNLVATDGAGNRFWRARDTVLPRDMAVTLLPDTPHTPATVARTLRAGRLHHIGLPQTLDVGSTDTVTAEGSAAGMGTAYVVGQWVDGATLSDLLTGGPLDADVATSLTAKIADAVGEAHRNGIALGAIHPSLVRVNFDGQVRLSHVIAHAGATTDADIRAVGALLYLMLTGTWPLAAADGAPQLTPAPTRGGREMPAAEVNPAVPVALSALAERALHPDDPQGIHAIGAITALLRPAQPVGRPGAGTAAAASGAAADASPARVLGPAERSLIRERRIKLSIAGTMLVAMAALIVIVVASVFKNFLTGITDPIKAADQQQVIVATTPTTTRTVGSPTTAPATTGSSAGASTSTSGSPAPSTTAPSTTATSTPAAAAKPVHVAGAAVYDPQGTPPKDYESYVDRAFDGDPSTFWMTWVYKQQFGPGGIKDGVGLLMTFDKAVTPGSVTVTGSPGTGVEIRSADSANPSLGSTKVLGSAALGADPVSITLSGAPSSKYLILWVSKLAPYSGDSAKNQGQFQSSINEVTVSGS